MAYGHTIHVSLDGLINKVPYLAEVPEYSFIKPEAFESGSLEVLSIPDKAINVLSRITIATMIDFCDRIIPFKIIQTNDIIEIFTCLTEYIKQLNEYSDVEAARKYLPKARNFHDKLQVSMTILSKTNPQLLRLDKDEFLLKIFARNQENVGAGL